MPNPIAPVAHHWLDSTHISFGVATAGVYGRTWKAEGSIFNGREPDDRRYDFDVAALDSYSGRLWLMPSPAWSLQVSAGHLADAEDGEDVNRVTASVTHHRLIDGRSWATTLAWGLNREAHHSTPAWIAETALDLTDTNVVFGRAEVVRKSAAELVLSLADHEPATVGKVQMGYMRWLGERGGVRAGIGGSVGLSFVPSQFAPGYGKTRAAEAALFFKVQP